MYNYNNTHVYLNNMNSEKYKYYNNEVTSKYYNNIITSNKYSGNNIYIDFRTKSNIMKYVEYVNTQTDVLSKKTNILDNYELIGNLYNYDKEVNIVLNKDIITEEKVNNNDTDTSMLFKVKNYLKFW